jgi:tetratricopeptide (TPR) repeat protein
MAWTVATIVAVLFLLALFVRTPMRRAIALTIAAQRACKRRDLATAARCFQEAHASAGKLREPKKSLIESQIEIAWATLLYRQGKMGEAEDMLRRGFSRTRAAGCHPQMRPAYAVWGDLCTDQERYIEAEAHYRTAIEGEEQIGNTAGMIFNLQRLGDSLVRQGRRDEAEEAIDRAIVLETQVVGEQMARQRKEPSQHRIISWSLPDLHFCRGQYEDARKLYQEKVEYWERSATRPDNIDLGHLQMRLAMSGEHTGHRAEALDMYARAEKTFEREWGEGHPKTAAARQARVSLQQEALGIAGEVK